MIQSDTQMQRVVLQLLSRSRRQRKHVLPLPPAAFVLEPGDILEWTSARNGYDAKLFEIDGVDYETSLNITASVTEVDPSDYDWDTCLELPVDDGRVIITLPAPKVVDGFTASAYVWVSEDNNTKRPAIRLEWDPPTDGDIVAVRWQLRALSEPDNVTSGTAEEADVQAGQIIILGGLQSLTSYQVRARFESFNGYAADWSAWINVTTPDARFATGDFSTELADRGRRTY
jgi:hypothetical protein